MPTAPHPPPLWGPLRRATITGLRTASLVALLLYAARASLWPNGGGAIGYVAATPLWRPSYRVVVGKGGADLQVWGIVQNLSGEDWKDVELTLEAAGIELVLGEVVGGSQFVFDNQDMRHGVRAWRLCGPTSASTTRV